MRREQERGPWGRPRGEAPREKEDKVLVKKSKLDGADDIGANFDAAAAVTVATGTAALVAGAVSSDARGAMGSAAAAAGQGLLAFAKELPWVAPILFLIAGVVKLRRKCTRSRLTRRCSARTCRAARPS